MTRSTGQRELPKAWLRLDPDIDQKHPDNGWNFIRLLCAANRQRPRGVFANRRTIELSLGKHACTLFYARGDVVDRDDGKVEMVGWASWQEGDLTVAERVSRVRNGSKNVTPVDGLRALPERYTGVTPAATMS